MNTLWIVVIGVLTAYLAYNFYAKRIDRSVIQSDAKRATPARMYMDGVDFMPTSRNILFGYHFKAIAAAGPIVGPITAANLWGWSPALAWLVLGVSFIGWVSDYSAIMVAVRNDGNSLSAIAHRLIAPRTRTILFVFIFFYLMLLAGAFIGILAAILSARPDVPFGIVMLALMGLLAGQMMYRWKMGIMGVTVLVVALTLGGMVAGPWGQHRDEKGALVQGPVAAAIVKLNGAVDSVSDRKALFEVEDPTMADPRIPAVGKDGKRPTTSSYDSATGQLKTLPNYLFWMAFLFAFSYMGANLPIWRFAQPVNYIGFWITSITILLSALGMVVAPLLGTKDASGALIGAFALPALKDLGFAIDAAKAWQPLWPMLFVTIACGAISGWHALVGSIGTARQLEYDTDGLPVGAGAMLYGEFSLALLSLTGRRRRPVRDRRRQARVCRDLRIGSGGVRHRARLRHVRDHRTDGHAARLPRDASDACRVGGRCHPAHAQHARRELHLDGLHGRAGAHRHLGIPVADVRRLQPADGCPELARGVGVAQV
jgi:carbon starvation protein